MLPVWVIAFEIFIVIMFGAFFRLDTSTLTNASSFTSNLVFLFGFALLGAARKNLSWSSLGNLLILVGICMQWNLLWSVFWNSCFNGFSKEYRLSVTDLVQCEQCVLCLMLIGMDLVGRVYYSQLVYISLIMSVGFSLNSAVFNYGIKIFDGGAGMQVFLFSAVFVLVAWASGMRMKNLVISKQDFTYHSQTLALVGLLLIVYAWPSFNMAGAILTSNNTLVSLATLQSAAFSNTIFGMSAGILCSLLLMTPHTKSHIHHYVEAIIDGGIIIASITDILLYPVATIVLSGLASFSTIILFKYFSQSYMLVFFPQSTLRVLFGFLASVFAAIATAARITQTPTLANNLSTLAGMELAGLAITVAISALFGAGCGLILVFVEGPTHNQIEQDATSWEIMTEESKPIIPYESGRFHPEESPRLEASLMPKYRLDIPMGAGSIKKVELSRIESERFPHTVREDNLHDSPYRKPQGTIIRQTHEFNDPRKTSDFAARPTNIPTLPPATLSIRELQDMLKDGPASRPVGRQLDFDSAPSDVGQQNQANQAL